MMTKLKRYTVNWQTWSLRIMLNAKSHQHICPSSHGDLCRISTVLDYCSPHIATSICQHNLNPWSPTYDSQAIVKLQLPAWREEDFQQLQINDHWFKGIEWLDTSVHIAYIPIWMNCNSRYNLWIRVVCFWVIRSSQCHHGCYMMQSPCK